MKFLCLPGAGMRKEVFKDLLSPVIETLQSHSNATFHFVNGPYEMLNVPAGFEDYLGPPPNPQLFSHGVIIDALASVDTNDEKSPEAMSRDTFEVVSEPAFRDSVVKGLALLNEIIAEEGPFEGIIGYSEGGMMASTLLYARMQSQPLPSTTDFKCAIFFSSFATFSSDGSKVILADEIGEILRIPTCHVLGSDDPLVGGSIALYNLCSPLNRVMVETGSNHLILWNQENLLEIQAVQKFVSGVLKPK